VSLDLVSSLPLAVGPRWWRALQASAATPLKSRDRARDPASRPNLPILLSDRDLTALAVNIHPDESQSDLPLVDDLAGRQRASDTDGYVLSAHPGESQGRPRTTAGSQPISYQRPALHALPRNRRPGVRILPGPPDGSKPEFHASITAVPTPAADSAASSPSATSPTAAAATAIPRDKPSSAVGTRTPRAPAGTGDDRGRCLGAGSSRARSMGGLRSWGGRVAI